MNGLFGDLDRSTGQNETRPPGGEAAASYGTVKGGI